MTTQCELYKVMSSVKVFILLSVVTNGNTNLMPTISPFGISDKTLISHTICTSKEFMHILRILCTYIHDKCCAFICSCINLFFLVKLPILRISQFLPLYLITNISPPLFNRPISLPLFVNNAKGLYIYIR